MTEAAAPDPPGRGRGGAGRSIRYSLEQEGFTVTLAADGGEAIERFRSDVPASVILDLMLPKLSGLDVCRIIRRSRTSPS